MQNYSKFIKNLKSEEINVEYERIRSQSNNRSYSTKNSHVDQNKTQFYENISLKNQLYILQEQLNNEKQRSIQLENTIKKLKFSLFEQDKDLLQKCEQKIQNLNEKETTIKNQQEEIRVLISEKDELSNSLSQYQDLELTINQLTNSYHSIAPSLQEQLQVLEQCVSYIDSLTKLINPVLYGSTPQLQDLFKTKQKQRQKKKFQISELCETNTKLIQEIENKLVIILEQIDQKYINEFTNLIN